MLEDGSYSTEVVHDEEEEMEEKNDEESHFRNLIAEDSIVGGVFTRNVGKMLYKVRKTQKFNKIACSLLMILCSLLRNYELNISTVDQATIDQISTLIRKVINPETFVSQKDSVYETKGESMLMLSEMVKQSSEIVQKNPSDLIFFRQLKKGNESIEEEFDDEEVNEIIDETFKKQDFISKLTSMVQLTGYFDPLYA